MRITVGVSIIVGASLACALASATTPIPASPVNPEPMRQAIKKLHNSQKRKYYDLRGLLYFPNTALYYR